MNYICNSKFHKTSGFRIIDISENDIYITNFLGYDNTSSVKPDKNIYDSIELNELPDFIIPKENLFPGHDDTLSFYKHSSDHITLDEFRQSTDFSDNTIFMLYGSSHDYIYKGYYNILALSSHSKTNFKDMKLAINSGIIPIAYVCIKSAQDNFLDMNWTFIQDVNYPNKTNIDDKCTELTSSHYDNGTISITDFPDLNISILEKTDDYFIFEVVATYKNNIYDKEIVMYVDTDCGYLPKKKIAFSEKTTFKLYTLGLDKGDKINIKLGYRYWKTVTKLELYV